MWCLHCTIYHKTFGRHVLYYRNNSTLLPVTQSLCLALSRKVCVYALAARHTHSARDPETQGRWTEMEVQGEVCETEIRAGLSAECQSCCWSWPPHMAPCPGFASRCVTSESAVCVSQTQTPTTRTLSVKRATCVITPPSPSPPPPTG